MRTQIRGAQLDVAVLMPGPLEIVLPNTEIIYLCFWSHLNQIQETGSCFESDAILRTDGLTQATFLRWVIHKHIHFDTAGQVSNISCLSIPKHSPAMKMIPWYSIFFSYLSECALQVHVCGTRCYSVPIRLVILFK